MSGLPPASSSADPRRQAAIALARVEARGAHAARLLGDAPPAARELLLGALRWQGTLDALLARHLPRGLAGLDPEVRAILRIGLYEARRMSTPVPIAVSEAVASARVLAPRAGGLVNAVLRRAAAEPWPDPDDESQPLELRFSHPAWLVARWRQMLGEERLRAVLAADQQPAPLSLLASATDVEALEADGVELERHPAVPGAVVVAGGAGQAVRALRAGRAYAMDPSAVAVARLLPETDGLTADLTAAPGGKTLVLARERATRQVAFDRHLGRVALMRRTLARAGADVLVAVADAGAPALRDRRCAGVVLDAPCSGTGTLRRHPEIRWRLRASDLAALVAVQRRLARAAAALLANGGHLLYATCSLEPEENAEVVATLGLEPVPLEGRLPAGVPHFTLPSGGAVLLPGPHGDGFTAHLLRRP